MRVATWLKVIIKRHVAHRCPAPAWVLWFYWWIQTSYRCPRCTGRASRCSWSASPPPAGRLSHRSLNETTLLQTAVKTARCQTERTHIHRDIHKWITWTNDDCNEVWSTKMIHIQLVTTQKYHLSHKRELPIPNHPEHPRKCIATTIQNTWIQMMLSIWDFISILQHLDKPGNYARILFVDFSSGFNIITPDLLSDKPTQLSVPTSICPDRQAAASEAEQTHIQDSYHQHWRSSGLCSLPTALLPLHQWPHFKGPLCQLLKFADDTTVIDLIKDGDESAYRQEVEQLAVWCGLNNLELNTLKTVEMIVDFRRNPPLLSPTHHHGQHCGCSGDIQVPGNHHLSGPEVGQSHRLHCKKGPAEAVCPPPAKEVQLAFGATETVLLCHHRDCPVFIYNCLVWFSYQNRQKTTTDRQDCWEDYRCPSAQSPITLQSWRGSRGLMGGSRGLMGGSRGLMGGSRGLMGGSRGLMGGSRGLMDRALDLKPEVMQGCGFESRLWQEVSMTEVRPLSKAPQLLPGRCNVGRPLRPEVAW